MTSPLPRYRFIALSGATALSRVLGFVRSMIIASYLGAQFSLDIFYSLNVLIGLLIVVFADQLEMVISCETARLQKESPGTVPRFQRQAFTSSLLISVMFCAILWLTLSQSMPLVLPRVSEESDRLLAAVFFGLLPFILLYIPFRAVLALLRGTGAVTFSIFSDAFQSLLLCAFTLAALNLQSGGSPDSSVAALAMAHGAAFMVSTAITIGVWQRRLRHGLFALPDRNFIRQTGSSLTELSLLNYLMFGLTLIDRRYAGLAQAGGIALLSYASSLSMTVRSVINYEQLHVLEFASSGNRSLAVQRAVWRCLLLAIPAGVFLVVFSHELIRLIYERGAFTPELTAGCAPVLQVYGSATALFLIWQIALRILQVEKLIRPLLVCVAILIPLDILLAQQLIQPYGVAGAVSATALVHIPMLGTAAIALKRKSGISLMTAGLFLGGFAYLGYCGAAVLLMQTIPPVAESPVLAMALLGILTALPLPLLWRDSTLDTLVRAR